MAMSTPVVCSAQANSALNTQTGRDILVGDTPEAIARHILDLLASPEKRSQLGAAGRRYVQTYHTWDHAGRLLEKLYRGVTLPAREAPAPTVGVTTA
jgi:glycosyltransferase involved in cell wall biosynthesis